MSRFREDVLDWFDAGRVVPGGEDAVLRAAGMLPTRADWHAFLGRLTLWLGTVALAAALIFFFAFNWDDLGRFGKFGLVEAAMVAALFGVWRVGLDGLPGKALLLLLVLLTGALLALAGQVYQTGADTFELFAWWAVLILPWVLVGRFAPLWLVWLALLNLALYLFADLSHSEGLLLWGLYGVNGLALILWETAQRRGVSWLDDDWPPRLVAVASGTMATALAVRAIGSSADGSALGALAYAAWLAAFYGWYRRVRPDLFMLAGGVLSLIVVVIFFLAEHVMERADGGGFLLTGLVVLGMSAGGAIWLKSVAREQRA
ncbi:DUF2157 domain-containing protein [Sphingosinicella sp. BN140058]|uniref:DUF2157 domain-containing protein n=1 Tax=Sphingosinicella sp. BN140058 TaxID=1892855 RepID=UPI0010135A67|nr:DUF2157 domain-containing protein [Sphingosinicella sp. BN140058]QAY77802.1 DUF2157 domain-containing protein [Sphingosinicella sp. BN140058]